MALILHLKLFNELEVSISRQTIPWCNHRQRNVF